ncbi:MAG TPA: TonB-dependent receptor, partial [Puia sp.]|nr:TonB-dependent receptor [Puia sp.]
MKIAACLLIALSAVPAEVYCQSGGNGRFWLVVINEQHLGINGATVKLIRNGKPAGTAVAGQDGRVLFGSLPKGVYTFLISSAGYQPKMTPEYRLPGPPGDSIVLAPRAATLQEATVTARALPVERKRDRTIINVDASPVNTGATVLEVLERSPGVTVDRNGGISLNGKPGVLVMIDDKPTYLTGDDLNNLLSSMNAAQVAKIELISNPPARYDAAGNAGIINIKTKKSDRAGFNGVVTTSYAQGVYPKSNNSLVLNYKTARTNSFFNYSFNDVDYLTNLYAYRKYYDDNKNVAAILQQPAYFSGNVVNNTAKAGLDYSPSARTTVGMQVSGVDIHRSGSNTGHADWLDAAGNLDSSLLTKASPENSFRNGTLNLNARQSLAKNAELKMDIDYLHYQMLGKQNFDNQLLAAGGYDSVFRSSIPTTIDIYSGKVDADAPVGAAGMLQAGVKWTSSHTDNSAT